MNKTCETCAWWSTPIEPFENSPSECRRYPPRVIIRHSDHDAEIDRTFYGRISEFPDTLVDDWCGEWRKKEDEENE